MRIIINDRVALQTLTGVGHYTAQLLRTLPQVDPRAITIQPALSPLLGRKWPPIDGAGRAATGGGTADPTMKAAAVSALEPTSASAASGPTPARVSVPGGDKRKPEWLRRTLQAGYRAFFALRGTGCDLYHEPNHIPLPSRLPTVTTIHDLSVIEHPDWHPADRVRWYEREFDRGVRQSSRFIAASEFTKQRMIARLGIAGERIDVTLQAARSMFVPRSPAELAVIRARWGLPQQFFLFVGTLEPRKNVPGLLDAFTALPPATRRRCPLVIVGGWGWNTTALREKLDRVLTTAASAGEIRQFGYADDAQLADLYASCTALVWPTFYEGFGLPPLETMACGNAVIASQAASIPEVVGDAGVLIDPLDTPRWTAAMERIANDDTWRQDLAQRGFNRAAGFSWQRCAAETVATYRRTVAS